MVYDTMARTTAQPVIDNFFHKDDDDDDDDLFSTLICSYVELESGSDSSSKVCVEMEEFKSLQ